MAEILQNGRFKKICVGLSKKVGNSQNHFKSLSNLPVNVGYVYLFSKWRPIKCLAAIIEKIAIKKIIRKALIFEEVVIF